jgi:hypothetical protein
MSEKINQITSKLVGLQLIGTTRASSMECLKFGNLYMDATLENSKNIVEFAVHLQCTWRITDKKEIIVGSSDLYENADLNADYNPDFDWSEINSNLRDIKLRALIKDNNLIVKSAKVDIYGGIDIEFNQDFTLATFPDLARNSENEFWRLINVKDINQSHLVSSTTGLEV